MTTFYKKEKQENGRTYVWKYTSENGTIQTIHRVDPTPPYFKDNDIVV